MFGWSPPNILATLVLFYSLLLHCNWSPTQAKPYPKQDLLSTYTTGSLGGLNERDWPELINYKNGDYIERDKRSPTEVEDESPNSSGHKTLTVKPRKRQGIETPIQPLTSDSGLGKDTLSHLNTDENVRSKVDQPDSESTGVPVEEEKKTSDDRATESSSAEHQQESKENVDNSKLKSEESNEGQEKEHDSSSKENANSVQIQQGGSGQLKTENNGVNDKADSSSESINDNESTADKNSANVQESKVESSKPVDENAQVRSVQESADEVKKLRNLPNDKNTVIMPGSSSQLGNSPANTIIAGSKANPQEAQTLIKNNVNKQVNGDETKISTEKGETPVTTTKSSDQNTAAPADNSAENSQAKTQSSPQESAAIHTVPQIRNVPVGPVRDALGNSGSEIVTTRGASDLDSYTERDTEPKPTNGPEVGHFQVDDKSADLEINANSAGVKVKAKPASLQVVSRPGSHSPSAAAQERSFYHHYHYPPYHPHHHWYPGMRRSYGHFHRSHFYNPYHSFPERRGFESFYDEAPFYRRHMHYWYPHRHRHHFHDSDLYERSRMEEPDDYPKYHGRRRHKRRFRHMNGPYRRQFYNNIPIMNGMESPQMGMIPEEGTMPQLPIGGGVPFTQRQNIMTPMPAPINVVGNPPPGLLGGINAPNFALNGMNGLNSFNGANQMNNLNAFSGISDMNNMGAMGLNSLGPMGAMEGLPGGINTGMQGMAPPGEIPVTTRALGSRNSNSPSEAPRMAFKKTAILSSNKSATKEQSNDQKPEPKKDNTKAQLNKPHGTGKMNKGKVNLKSWEKTLKRYHRLNVFTSKTHERHQFRRNAKSDGMKTEKKEERKHSLSHPRAQHPKDVKGNRKNAIVMHRPPIIYHPPPEIYHRPDIVVHRAPIMLHRPPIIYHQPPVVVHRPAIIYHQPPIVFHQPPPVVHQPILHSHDTWVTKPMVYHTASMVSHAKTYYGIPSHVYSGEFGEGCHGAHCSYRKGKVPHSKTSQAKNSTHQDHTKKTKRDSFSDYMAYFTSLWKRNGLTKREIDDQYDFITSTDGSKEKLTYRNMDISVVNKRDIASEHNSWIPKVRRETEKEESEDSKEGTQKKKKKDVVVNRPPIIYHPPPEIYHRPDIVVHRPPLVIHRPPIIYHQPPVIVHRPAVVYHQPPIVFHQPPPAVSQPLLYSHDSFTVHPSFYATHHGSVVRDFGHYVGVPNVITNYGNPLFGRPPPIGKRSKIEGSPSTENATVAVNDNSTAAASKRASLDEHDKKAKNETSEKAGKKNTVIVRRPPIIYHPPPEIYHRPIIVVHRPPIMIHRAPIFYHQPPVVVHRPAIVYHQPPLIFHQPPPMVHQPVLKSHDTWISHPVVTPYSSRVLHHHTYIGVPDAYTVHHFGGHGNSFYKSHILKQTKSFVEKASARNEISGDNKSTKSEKDSSHNSLHDRKGNVSSKLKTKKATSQKGGKKNAVILRRPPVIYHPPPEIYHRPEIVVHRAPIVIHRAPIIYHQPPVIVHRPAIVYHQPAIIFHQPPPVVHQPVFRSHDTYVHRPEVRLYGSRMHHVGHMYHIPHAYYHGHGGIHYMAYGKSKVPQKEHIEEEKGDTRGTVKGKKGHRKSKTEKTEKTEHNTRRKHIALTRSKDKTETGTKLHKNHRSPVKYHKAKEVTEKANKKNSVVIHRPPIIYHPPPEIYHRPDIVVHRAPIVLYRAPIIYHQPPVVVHRPAIVYHQPPIVFHQPPPMVHQPVLHSHDTWVTKPVVIPYASHVRHVATYKGVPHEEIFMHGIGTGAFGKSRVPMRATRRDKVDGVEGKNQNGDEETKTTTQFNKPTSDTKNPETKHVDDTKQTKESNNKLGAGERITRALTDSLIHKQWKNRNPVGAATRIQRSLPSLLPDFDDQVPSRYSSEFSLDSQGYDEIPEEDVAAATRIQRSIDGVWSPYMKPLTHGVTTHTGAGARIHRALADPWTTFEGEKPYEMYKRSSEENQTSTPDENADKNTNSTKKTLLIIHRPPILYHPPSHMIHRPSIVVHRPDIIVHRHPIIFHRPPILMHRPPIIIHRQPVLIHRPPIIVHRPPLVFHRPPIIIHRRPYIIHHHPIIFHRPPLFIHKGPQMIVHHSHLIHHYPMHMIHMHCPGCGFGKSTVARLEDNSTEHDNKKTSHSDRSLKDSTVADSKGKSSNKPKRSVADKKSKKSSMETDHHRKKKDGHKKKKDVVVNRPPIIYHPPPEVYHRPDIVVHRAPILIHRPPIVYHQPPVVVHRPAVVYHQPPIVFHQPAPAVNQPVLYSHDSFVVHPMAFASHMGSVVNDAGHYVGLPHGGVTNFPGNIPHGPTGHLFPTLNQAHWARRTEVSKPQDGKHAKINHEKHREHKKRSSELKDDQNGKGEKLNVKPTQQKSKHTKGERKNKVIVARPPMIYHPPPEIYDRPDIVVHRPDIVIHRPSIVYHQPSVVVHRAPVVYQQPPVVFHQPAPMVKQPIYNAHDTYVAHPVFHPQESHIAHSATYVGAPHLYPGHNDYGWGLSGHVPTVPTPQYHYASNYGYSGFQGYTPSPAYGKYGYYSYGPAFGRSEVESGKNNTSKQKDEQKHNKKSTMKKDTKVSRKRRSAELSKRHFHHHHHHHHHSHHHRHNHHHHGTKRFYHLRPISGFAHRGHRKHVVIIHRPPLIYHPPPQVYRQPDILMHLPPLVYHRPAIIFRQPPTIVHHPSIIYHQPSVVFHNPPPIIHTPMIHSHEILTPHFQHIMLPTSSYVHPAGNYFGPVVQGAAYGKSHIERTDSARDSTSSKSVIESEEKGDAQKTKPDKKRETTSTQDANELDSEKAKKRNVDLVVHQPPIVYHPPPDIFDKPTVVMHPPPLVVHRPLILIHRAPVVVHRPPVIIHRPPIVLHHPTPVYHVAHGHFFHPMGLAFGKSSIANESTKASEEDTSRKTKQMYLNSTTKEKSKEKKGERKNLVVVHRPPMIYHPPPEIYDRPDVVVHRPDIVVHRPSIVYHQPSVVVHRPPIIYHQPPIVFHQPPPMIHQPIMHAHDTYLAHPVPVPYTSHVHHAATYVGAPHYFHHPQFGGYVSHAFGKSAVEKVDNKTTSEKGEHSRKETSQHTRLTRDTANDTKTQSRSSQNSKGHKKNKVIIARPPMIYHPPPEIYDRPNIIVHRPDIVIHRPSIVYHQSSVVVHRPPVIYQQPPVVFHQPSPLVHQPIMHAHDTYVPHPVPVPYSSHIEHTSTYVGSPHHYPGGWNYGWSQPHPFGPAFGKSKVPKTNSKSSKGASSKTSQKDKVKRTAKGDQGINDKETKPKSEGKSKKKNQVIMQRAPLIYHPPPEIYHKPDVVMHRPDIVIHRPSVVYHQPSVVVHRPPVIYQQPPVVFHQPSPMVNQPVVHAHDTYLAHPYFMPYSSHVFNGGSYVGAPHFYGSGWGMGGHEYGFGHAFGKSDVAKVHKKQKTDKPRGKGELKGSRRTLEQEAKNAEDAVRLKNETKTTAKGNKKNLVIMRRPPLIYHPPPEVYHKPDVIMHRPDIVIHRPSIVFHQPSVVVHRPPVIYHQPPVVFHQPSPMVHQPIFHSHDTYLAHPHFVPFTSDVHHAHSYVGAPHFYPGDWGWGGHGYGYGFRHAFGKSKVEKATTHHKKSKNDIGKESEGNRRTLHSTKAHKTNDKLESRNNESKGHKKNLVVMHRPPLIYHPPPEVYHRPDVIVHRPDIVIHRPSVVFHQPSVVVHRPPVIYHQPPVVFHQPSPMVHQPIFHSHETYLAHPHFVPLLSHVTHAGSYVGAPHFYPGHLGPAHGFGHFMGHAFYKSKVEKGSKKEKLETRKKGKNGNQGTLFPEAPHNKTKRATYESSGAMETHPKSKLLKHIIGGGKKGAHNKDVNKKAEIKGVYLHPQKEDKKRHHKGHKKNMVVIQRPTLIYHPPPEIYDRPDVIVHRPDFVIHQPSVVYHQPSVVVHRPPIIYHPPPVVFHQPSPMVHQPVYTAHDMYHSHPYFVPYSSNIKHTQTYVGAPHYYAGGWRYGYGFSDNAIPHVSSWHKWNGFRGPWYPSSLYRTNYIVPTTIANRRVLRGPYPVAFSKSLVQKHTEKPEDSSKTHGKHSEKKHISRSQHSARKGVKRNPRSVETSKSATTNLHALKNKLHKKGHQNGKGGKKNQVVLRRPLLVYHPPPEVYHRPDVIVHRPDIVIHQPSVVYHQPSVMVHRPPVIYNQPPVVFHQPAPMVNQPIFHAHESYMAHLAFVPFTSHIQHSGTYVGAPDFFHGGWNYGYGHAFGKSHVLKHKSNSGQPNIKNRKLEMKTKIEVNEKQESRKGNILHPQDEKDEKPSRKNDIVVSRPPIIYHPPPEIYHRPDIVVHRAPIVLHRPPIIYHQPPVVVHRPAVVYHQPPIVFHQPPPAVNQPILHSHDSFILRPAARFLPQGSTVTHSMSYVGIPNHVVHGDELDFHHFHRSQIEHSGKSKSLGKKPQITKSTISKTPTTKTENTETTITDQTQKKTLRSTIHHHTLNKRQLMGSHSLYGPVSPINDIQDLHTSIEQKEKLSTIPGKTSNREHEVAKRSDESGYDITKRQLVIPETTENVYHTSIPSVYNTLEAAALQNQALAETEGIPHSDGINLEHLPGLATNLHAIQELEGAGIAPSTFPLSLQQYLPTAPKDDSPDVRVHVETTKSSIPLKKRTKRQLLPLYQQQAPIPVQRVLYQAPSLGGPGVIHATAPSSVYNLFNAYHPAYHAMTSPLNYLSMFQQLRHRPHVNINVQSARSTIPSHVLEKRSKDSKSKRQLLAIAPPVPNVIPFGFEGAGMIHNYPPYSPLTALSRFSLPLLANLKYPDEYEPTEPAYPEALPLFHQYPQHIHKLYSTLPEDENSESPPYNPWASYLAALYNSFLGYPLYHSHHKPKVHVEVQASKSHIPKVIKTEKKHKVHSRAPITKRQLYNYIPDSSLTTGHYPLPTALNYGIQGIPFHHNSPRININVETAKKNGIPSVIKQKRSPKRGSTKQREENKTADKRDELVDGEQNDQAISANQGNSDFANAPENQFVATSETAQSEEGPTSNDEGQPQGQGEIPQQQTQEEMVGQSQELQQNSGLPQGQGEIPQQQPQEEMVGQRQELQQNSGQQLLPSQDQPVMAPSQSQPLAFRAFNTPIQLPVQQPLQPAFQVPFQAPFVVPFQGMLPNALQVASGIPETEQSSSQPGVEAEEVQPKHTSINVNVAAKSTVPKKRSKKSKHPLHKRQFVPLTQGYVPAYGVPIPYNGGTVLPSNRKPRVSINVQTAKKSAVEQVHNKRESISLLTRFPAMQVLPQTFKQNGILMPAFNTLPVNHKIKANGMLLEELQRQRKHQIPKTAKETITSHSKQISQRSNVSESSKIRKVRKKENAKKRQFYAVPQSPLAVQQYPLISHPNLHPKPRVSVNVEVSRISKKEFPRKNHGLLQLEGVKRKLRDREGHPLDKTTAKRQVYGIEQLPHMVHLPVVGTPLLSQIPLRSQRPRVSVHVETAKKKNKLLSQKEHRKDSTNKEKRQIYGLSELPHEGLPVPISGQGEALGYFPITERSPHVSVNVEASKRSDDDDDVIHKRQVLGLQPPLVQPVEQDQEPIAMINGEESLQSHEPEQVGLTQSPIQETEQFNSLPAGIHSNSEAAEQEQVEEESPDAVRPSQAALSENDYQRPRVSVHVESSKRSEDEREHKARKHIAATSHTGPWKGSKRQLQQHELEREDYEPEEEATAANQADLLQEQRPRVSVHVDVAKKKHNVADIPSLKKIKNHVHKANARHPVRRQITVPFNGGLNTIQGGPIQNTQFVMGRDQQENEQGAREVPIPLQSQSEVPEQQQQQQQSVQQVIQPAAFLQPDQQQQQQQQFPAFQQVMLPVGHTMEEKTRPKVSISVQTTKSLISKTNDHAKSLSYHKEQPTHHKLRRQLFGTVPLLSSLGQPTLNGARKENGRSTVPQSTKDVPNHTQDGKTGGRSWKRQLYNYLGGQQEQQFVPTQSLESATDTQQQGQELPIQPIQTFQQDAGVQLTPVNLPPASLLQTSDQGSPQAYPTQLEVPENNQQASATPIETVEPSASPDSPFQRPHVSINVQTAKSQVPKPTRMFQNHGLKDKAVRSKQNSAKGQETKKFKRQFDLLGGSVIERRRGPKFVGGPLKKTRPENLFGLGNNLNKPVEVFADPISNLVGGGGAGRKRPKLGGIRLDSPTGVGALPLKGAATPLEGALPPDLGAATILQDSPTGAAAPFAQDAGITNEPLFRPPSGMAGPQLDALEREGEGANNVPLNDLPSIRPAVLPLPSINRAFLPNLPIPPAAPPLENPLLSPRILPIGPILPIAPPVAVPPPLQETAPPEVPQVPPRLAPILPPMFPMPLPSMAPDSALTNPDSLLPGPGDDKPSVHVNVETSRSSVPETEHHSKQHAKGQANRG